MEALGPLVEKSHAVISLLPYIYHFQSAKVALKYGKHFCTASYVSDDMETLHEEAKEKGLLLLNECGVDPGLDHMSAMRVIDAVHAKGGEIKSFYSVCGGLPAPAANNNPLGYKLSWSPRGVLLASRNNALYLEDGKHKECPGKMLYSPEVYKKDNAGGDVGALEWYPNRDSCKFVPIYKIPEVETIIRGTFRYPGWCKAMRLLAENNFTSLDPIKCHGKNLAQFTCEVLGSPDADVTTARALAAKKFGLPEDDDVLDRMAFLGLFDDKVIIADTTAETNLDVVCVEMEKRMQYADNEQDMIVMKHTFEIEYPETGHRETQTSTLIDLGLQNEGGHSSMSRTVSIPLAICVRAALEGRLTATGIVRPIEPELYNLVMDEMEKDYNVKFVEETLAPHFWLRHEVKGGEERVILTPSDCAKLLADGFRVSVENSPTRCIPDAEYAAVGCNMVETGSWVNAPVSAIITGLKELPEDDMPLRHRHIYFAHCYKNQDGWKDVMNKFINGKGLLYDLEFLVDDNGRRVAAFGRAAGVVGMALSLKTWALRNHKDGPQELEKPVKSWKSTEALVADVKAALDNRKDGLALPSALVIGALGRCGGGATWFAEQVGVNPVKWDMAETSAGGPFPQLAEQDVLVNCIYLSAKINPFLTNEIVDTPGRKLSVFCDVSCDSTNPNNPFPIYVGGTTMFEPLQRVREETPAGPSLDVIAIDHLPSLVPNDSSSEFSGAILPHLQLLNCADPHSVPVWGRAKKLYEEKKAAALA